MEVLTTDKGLLTNTSPTGTQYVVEYWPANNALWRIRSTNKSGPEVAELAGTYTSQAKGQAALTRYLISQWAYAESVEAKLAKKRQGGTTV